MVPAPPVSEKPTVREIPLTGSELSFRLIQSSLLSLHRFTRQFVPPGDMSAEEKAFLDGFEGSIASANASNLGDKINQGARHIPLIERQLRLRGTEGLSEDEKKDMLRLRNRLYELSDYYYRAATDHGLPPGSYSATTPRLGERFFTPKEEISQAYISKAASEITEDLFSYQPMLSKVFNMPALMGQGSQQAAAGQISEGVRMMQARIQDMIAACGEESLDEFRPELLGKETPPEIPIFSADMSQEDVTTTPMDGKAAEAKPAEAAQEQKKPDDAGRAQEGEQGPQGGGKMPDLDDFMEGARGGEVNPNAVGQGSGGSSSVGGGREGEGAQDNRATITINPVDIPSGTEVKPFGKVETEDQEFYKNLPVDAVFVVRSPDGSMIDLVDFLRVAVSTAPDKVSFKDFFTQKKVERLSALGIRVGGERGETDVTLPADRVSKSIPCGVRYRIKGISFLDENGDELGGELSINESIFGVSYLSKRTPMPEGAKNVVIRYERLGEPRQIPADLAERLSMLTVGYPYPMDETSTLVNAMAVEEESIEKRARMIVANEASIRSVYTLDEIVGRFYKACKTGKVHALEGLGAGHCMFLSYRQANKLCFANVPAFVVGGPAPEAKSQAFLDPGHAQVVYLTENGLRITDPTHAADPNLTVDSSQIGEHEWAKIVGSISGMNKAEVHELAKSVRDRVVVSGKPEPMPMQTSEGEKNQVGHPEFEKEGDEQDQENTECIKWARGIISLRDAIKKAEQSRIISPVIAEYRGLSSTTAPEGLEQYPNFIPLKRFNVRGECISSLKRAMDDPQVSDAQKEEAFLSVLRDPHIATGLSDYTDELRVLNPEFVQRLSDDGLVNFIHLMSHNRLTVRNKNVSQENWMRYFDIFYVAMKQANDRGLRLDTKMPMYLRAQNDLREGKDILGEVATIHSIRTRINEELGVPTDPALTSRCCDMFLWTADLMGVEPVEWLTQPLLTERRTSSYSSSPSWKAVYGPWWNPLLAEAVARGRYTEWFTQDGTPSKSLEVEFAKQAADAIAGGNRSLTNQLPYLVQSMGMPLDLSPHRSELTRSLVDAAQSMSRGYGGDLLPNFPDEEHPISSILFHAHQPELVIQVKQLDAFGGVDHQALDMGWPTPTESELATAVSDFTVQKASFGSENIRVLGCNSYFSIGQGFFTLLEDGMQYLGFAAKDETMKTLALVKALGGEPSEADLHFQRWRRDYPESYEKFVRRYFARGEAVGKSVDNLLTSMQTEIAKRRIQQEGRTPPGIDDDTIDSYGHGILALGFFGYLQSQYVPLSTADGGSYAEAVAARKLEVDGVIDGVLAIDSSVYQDSAALGREISERSRGVFKGTYLERLNPHEQMAFFLKLKIAKAAAESNVSGHIGWSEMDEEIAVRKEHPQAANARIMACEAVLDTSSDITAYQDAGFAQSGKIFVDKVIAPRPLSPSGARKEMSFPTLLAYEHGMGLARSQSGEFEQFREITRGESVEGIDVHKSASREGYVRRVTKERVSVPVAFHVDLDWLAGTHNDHISDEPHENMIKLLRYIHKAVDEGLKPTLSVYYHGTRMRSFTGDQLAGAFKRPLRKNEGDRELFGEDIMRDLWQLSLKANLVLHNFWEVKTMPSHSMAEDEVIEPVKDGILFLAVSDELREQTVKKFGNLSSRLGCKIVKL